MILIQRVMYLKLLLFRNLTNAYNPAARSTTAQASTYQEIAAYGYLI